MPNVDENWVCSYCNHAQTITDKRLDIFTRNLVVEGWVEGTGAGRWEVTVCANPECRKLTVSFSILKTKFVNGRGVVPVAVFDAWQVLPSSHGRILPEYIPEPLRRDYEEACAIRALSPKASATLIRRCIQGSIRDFCGIVKGRLVDEIAELRKRVDEGAAPAGVQADTVDAIDHVRTIGNIGAHMEKDINTIIDVDPAEAHMLIQLAELLFDEWYIARYQRHARLQKVGLIAAEKAAAKLAD